MKQEDVKTLEGDILGTQADGLVLCIRRESQFMTFTLSDTETGLPLSELKEEDVDSAKSAYNISQMPDEVSINEAREKNLKVKDSALNKLKSLGFTEEEFLQLITMSAH